MNVRRIKQTTTYHKINQLSTNITELNAKFFRTEAAFRRCFVETDLFCKIHRKTLVLESVFNKVVGQGLAEKLQHRFFPLDLRSFYEHFFCGATQHLLMSGPELDLCPGFNPGLHGLNLGQRLKVDPAWAFPKCISENTKTSLNQQQGQSERRNSIMQLVLSQLTCAYQILL